jgi:hypothetical protein
MHRRTVVIHLHMEGLAYARVACYFVRSKPYILRTQVPDHTPKQPLCQQIIKHPSDNTIQIISHTDRTTFDNNSAPMGEHVALYGDIRIEDLMLPFTSCNSFVLSPPEPCDDPPPSNTHLFKYISGYGNCDWAPFAGALPLECKCDENGRIDVSSGNCRSGIGDTHIRNTRYAARNGTSHTHLCVWCNTHIH